MEKNEKTNHFSKTKAGLNVMTLGIYYETLMRYVGEANSVVAVSSTFGSSRIDPQTSTRKNVLIPDHLDLICKVTISKFSTNLVLPQHIFFL